jgi:hypothetical protein
VNDQRDAIRRALDALQGDIGEHPGHDLLEAYVEGRLTADQRAAIDRLAARSSIVAEDLSDLRAIHEAIAGRPMVTRNRRWVRVAAVAALAASLIVVVWFARPARVEAPVRVMTELTPKEEIGVRLAITSGRIALPDSLASLRPGEGTLLGNGSPAAFRLQSPVGTAVLETRPLFTWDDASADAYTVAVFDQNFSEVARGRVTGTSWRPEVDLARDATYSWQVTAHRGSQNITEPQPPRPEARFRIVDAATVNEVDELRRRLDNLQLQLGILLAERGLIADARVALMRARSVPETADVARRLLESLDQGTPMTTKPAQ